ncbi:hypothetical protein [Psychrobacter sp. FDAARGOS_221]|uniref:hypothetical protein n=1 Tax=Psychrobacter sp. FDAARGOS_221 TaxID=1975705 RepID=UPI000BB55AA6|nr:hypothetical protein [Psychrobacter sp. FDAARGOS_221]PNK59557.1 hypothetical protein A6J60_000765 [Psychrobacter sp. FDAARGOS_221]
MKVKLRNIDECDEFYRRLIGNVDLSHDKIYEVIEIQQSSYRLEGDRKEPALYDKRMFDIVDPTIPEGYIYQFYYEDSEEFHGDEDGFIWRDFEEEYNITPKCFAQRAFFDFYFDKHEEQVAIYNEYIKNRNKLD